MWLVWIAFIVVVCTIGVCWGLGIASVSDTQEDVDCKSWFGGEDNGNL